MCFPNIFCILEFHAENFVNDWIGAIWFMSVQFGFIPFASLFLLLLIVLAPLRWFLCIYFIWILYDRKTAERGGRSVYYARIFPIFSYVRSYFPISTTKVDGVVLHPRKNYLFCNYPHGRAIGFASASVYMKGGFTELFPHHEFLMVSLNAIFYVPLIREIYLSLGGIASSFESIDYVLSNPEGGQVVGLMVGGVEEMLLSEPGVYKVILKNRKGFIKVAMKNGTALVPVFSFGEVDCIETVTSPTWKSIQGFVKSVLHLPITIPKSFIPHKIPIAVVVGKPIEVDKNENPTNDEIDEVHQRFTEGLIDLFESEKHKYISNPNETQLEIL